MNSSRSFPLNAPDVRPIFVNHHDEENNNFNGREFLIRDDSRTETPFFRREFKSWTKTHYVQLGVMIMLVLIIFLLPMLDQVARNALHKLNEEMYEKNKICTDRCSFSLVESIPEGMVYPDGTTPYPSTYDTWMKLIDTADDTIEIGSFYWTMRGVDTFPHPSAILGEKVFESILKAGTDRGVNIKIAQSEPSAVSPGNDTQILMDKKAADVRSVDFQRLLGGGVLHTKLWLVDRKHFYIGSANMDWRSLTQVKELGIVGWNCDCMAEDIWKIFEVYWELGGKTSVIPEHWKKSLYTDVNEKTPISITDVKNFTYLAYVSSSPLPLCPEGRTTDIEAIINTIRTAKKFVYIAVMDYFPVTLYSKKVRFWPVIDDAIRTAAIENRVSVRLLISRWNHSRPSEDNFLRSLLVLSDSYPGVSIEIKRFVVPSTDDQRRIPFGRVNHNKYMVTDSVAYIGTSNWSADYFIDTAGVGFVLRDAVNGTDGVRSQLQGVFERDWDSSYAYPLV